MLGEKLKKLRLDNNLTQEELASKVFVTRNAISKWENNKGIPNIDSLKLLSSYFNVSLDYLINDNELKELAIKNNEMIIFNKNIIFSIIIFFSFIIVNVILPVWVLLNDPTAGLAVYLILMPVIFVVLGVITIILDVKWPFVLISSALSITPSIIILELIDFGVVDSFGYFVYFLIYISSYFLSSLLIKKIDKSYNSIKIKRFLLIISILISVTFLIHTIINTLILILDITSSAAYYTPLVINIFIYIIPLVVSWSLYIYYYFKFREKDACK